MNSPRLPRLPERVTCNPPTPPMVAELKIYRPVKPNFWLVLEMAKGALVLVLGIAFIFIAWLSLEAGL